MVQQLRNFPGSQYIGAFAPEYKTEERKRARIAELGYDPDEIPPPPPPPPAEMAPPGPTQGPVSAAQPYPAGVEQWRPLVSKYFAPEDVDKALYVINGESGGNASIENAEGSGAEGLFQILKSHGVNGKDPETAIKWAANQVYNVRGNWGDWGEGVLYQGQPFGVLGVHPYPGDSQRATSSAGGMRDLPGAAVALPQRQPNVVSGLETMALPGNKRAVIGSNPVDQPYSTLPPSGLVPQVPRDQPIAVQQPGSARAYTTNEDLYTSEQQALALMPELRRRSELERPGQPLSDQQLMQVALAYVRGGKRAPGEIAPLPQELGGTATTIGLEALATAPLAPGIGMATQVGLGLGSAVAGQQAAKGVEKLGGDKGTQTLAAYGAGFLTSAAAHRALGGLGARARIGPTGPDGQPLPGGDIRTGREPPFVEPEVQPGMPAGAVPELPAGPLPGQQGFGIPDMPPSVPIPTFEPGQRVIAHTPANGDMPGTVQRPMPGGTLLVSMDAGGEGRFAPSQLDPIEATPPAAPAAPAAPPAPVAPPPEEGAEARARGAINLGGMGKAMGDNYRLRVMQELEQGVSQKSKGLAEQMAEYAWHRGYRTPEEIRKALDLGQQLQNAGDVAGAAKVLQDNFPVQTPEVPSVPHNPLPPPAPLPETQSPSPEAGARSRGAMARAGQQDAQRQEAIRYMGGRYFDEHELARAAEGPEGFAEVLSRATQLPRGHGGPGGPNIDSKGSVARYNTAGQPGEPGTVEVPLRSVLAEALIQRSHAPGAPVGAPDPMWDQHLRWQAQGPDEFTLHSKLPQTPPEGYLRLEHPGRKLGPELAGPNYLYIRPEWVTTIGDDYIAWTEPRDTGTNSAHLSPDSMAKIREAKGSQVANLPSASELAWQLGKLREEKPRSIAKLYGQKGPTPEQAAAHAQQMRDWNKRYRALSKAQKEALARDNAAVDAARGATPAGVTALAGASSGAVGPGLDNPPPATPPDAALEPIAQPDLGAVQGSGLAVRSGGPLAESHQVVLAKQNELRGMIRDRGAITDPQLGTQWDARMAELRQEIADYRARNAPSATPPSQPAITPPPVIAGAVPGATTRQGMVRPSEIDYDLESFQTRDVTPGKPYNEDTVKGIVARWDADLFVPPSLNYNPETGRYTVKEGHHRTEAWRRVADKAGDPDRPMPANITDVNPGDVAQHARAREIAIIGNAATAPLNIREQIRAITALQGLGNSIEQAGDKLGLKAGTATNLMTANRLGPQAIERILAEKTGGLMDIAIELGRGMEVYGLPLEDASAWFTRIADNPKDRPTKMAVRETINEFGAELAERARKQATVGFPGMEPQPGEAQGLPGMQRETVFNLMAEATANRKALNAAIRDLKNATATVNKLAASPTATAESIERQAKTINDLQAERRRLEAQLEQSDDTAHAFLRSGAPTPEATAVPRIDRYQDLESAPSVITGPTSLWHGTGQPFTEFGDDMTSWTSLFGPGVYLTSDPDIARGYAHSSAKKVNRQRYREDLLSYDPAKSKQPDVTESSYGAQPTLQSVDVQPGLKLINLEVAPGADVKALIEENLKVSEEINGYDVEAWHNALQAIESGAPLKAVYSALKDGIVDVLGSENAVGEALEAFNDGLRGLGYDGLAHVGGINGGKKHLVTIIFESKNAKIGRSIPANAGVPAVRPTGGGAPSPFAGINNPPPELTPAQEVTNLRKRIRDESGYGDSPPLLARDDEAIAPDAAALGAFASEISGPSVVPPAPPPPTTPPPPHEPGYSPGGRPLPWSPDFVPGQVPAPPEPAPKPTQVGELFEERRRMLEERAAALQDAQPPPPNEPPNDGGMFEDEDEPPAGPKAPTLPPAPPKSDTIPGEEESLAAVRKHAGGMNVHRLQIRNRIDELNKLVPRGWFNTDNQQNVRTFIVDLAERESGGRERVPQSLRPYFDKLAEWLDEVQARDSAHSSEMGREMALIPDYFPGLYKVNKQVGTFFGKKGRPGQRGTFERYRNKYRTTREAVEDGAEFSSGNPSELIGMRDIEGVRRIEGDILFQRLLAWGVVKRNIKGQVPDDYAIPRGIPAFQPKPIPGGGLSKLNKEALEEIGDLGELYNELKHDLVNMGDADLHDSPAYQSTQRALHAIDTNDMAALGHELGLGLTRVPFMTSGYAVPKAYARRLEDHFMTVMPEPTSGGVRATNALAYTAGEMKKLKLIGSPFQHIDFLARGTASKVFVGGRFWEVPELAAEHLMATLIPAKRAALRREWETDPQLKMVMEEGGSILGGQQIARRELGKLGEALSTAPVIGPLSKIPVVGLPVKAVNSVMAFINEGLFDGVYAVVGKHVAKDWWASIKMNHPDWTDRQIAAGVAHNMNIMLSSQEAWQSLARNETTRQQLRALIFAFGENEGTLRGVFRIASPTPEAGAARGEGIAGKTIGNAWARYWIGYYVGIFMLANVIQYAITGEPLHPEQVIPLDIGSDGKPKFQSKFLRPIVGHNKLGEPLYYDLLGQLDTPVRMVTDPYRFLRSRFSGPVNIAWSQIQNKDYLGIPITESARFKDQLVDRLKKAGIEAINPIQSQNFKNMRDLQDPRAALATSLGANIRAGGPSELKDIESKKRYGVPFDELRTLEDGARLQQNINELPNVVESVTQQRKFFEQTGDTFQKVREKVTGKLDAEQEKAEASFEAGTNTMRIKDLWHENQIARRQSRGDLEEAFAKTISNFKKDEFDTALDGYYALLDQPEFHNEDGTLDFDAAEVAQQDYVDKLPAQQRSWVTSYLGLQRDNQSPLRQRYLDNLDKRESLGYFAKGLTPSQRNALTKQLDTANPEQDAENWYFSGVAGSNGATLQTKQAVDIALSMHAPNRPIVREGLARSITSNEGSQGAWQYSQKPISWFLEDAVPQNGEAEAQRLYKKPLTQLTKDEKAAVTGNINQAILDQNPELNAWLVWWGYGEGKFYTVRAGDAFVKITQQYGKTPPKPGYTPSYIKDLKP